MSNAANCLELEMPCSPSQHADLIIDGRSFERSTTHTAGELFSKLTGVQFLSAEEPTLKFMEWLDFMSILSLFNLSVGQTIMVKDHLGRTAQEGFIGQAIAKAEEQI